MQIVSNLPIPPRASGPRDAKYPFDALAVNQAFIVPVDKVPESRDIAVRAAANQYRRRAGVDHRFTVRNLPDGSVGVWRVS